jgi:lactoylglutathione lyase
MSTPADDTTNGAADGAHPPRPRMGAVGIGVSDLDRSVDFYTRVLGMAQLTTFTLPHMDEVVLGYGRGGGSALVLMHWTDGSEQRYSGNPVKVVLHLPDPAAAADAVRAEGLRVLREPAPVSELGGAVVGFAEDPDGYLVELLQA